MKNNDHHKFRKTRWIKWLYSLSSKMISQNSRNKNTPKKKRRPKLLGVASPSLHFRNEG